MIFRESILKGAFVIEPERSSDDRGYFARTWCRREFGEMGLDASLVQCGTSYNRTAGTLRGMHYQEDPYAETKLIRCTRGSVFDVIIDLRRTSATYMQHAAVRLSATEGNMLYVPGGFAHGFQTLEDDSELFYQISEYYHPEAARGIRWDDPAFRIEWPAVESRVISRRDRDWPNYVS